MKMVGDFRSSGQQPDVFPPGEITALLRKLSEGDVDVVSHVMAALYDDLRKIAAGQMRRERPDHTLEPAALVSELFLQLVRKPAIQWQSRRHFLGAASQEMRRFLVDYARSHTSLKRGGEFKKIQLQDCGEAFNDNPEKFLEVNELIDQLASQEPRMARVVEMRCFGGLTHQEIADVLGMDERTVKRDWSVARAWLTSQLRKGKTDGNVARRMGAG
jgi:RNA polymerase sigma-70 factor, ECF subfamily